MRIAGSAVLVVAALSLAACSSDPLHRALEGGAIGAGTGAVGAVVLGAPIAAGAAVGAAAGAVAGAVTKKSQVDLSQ